MPQAILADASCQAANFQYARCTFIDFWGVPAEILSSPCTLEVGFVGLFFSTGTLMSESWFSHTAGSFFFSEKRDKLSLCEANEEPEYNDLDRDFKHNLEYGV